MADIVRAYPTLSVALKSLLRAVPLNGPGLVCLEKVRATIATHGVDYLNVAANEAGWYGKEVTFRDIEVAFWLPRRRCRSRRSCLCKQRAIGREDLARRLLDGIVDGAAEVHEELQRMYQ